MTISVPLTRGLSMLIDAEDYYIFAGKKMIATKDGYAKLGKVPAHRVIMCPPRGLVVDHINGDKLDNRRANLRICSHAENMRNRKGQRKLRSQYKGVERQINRYRATITVDRQTRRIGSFTTEIAAARAYDIAAVKLHGEFARLNFCPSRDWLFVHEHEPLQAMRGQQ